MEDTQHLLDDFRDWQNDVETVPVAHFSSAMEAEIRVGQLESAGIPCIIIGANGNTMLPVIETRVSLLVRKEFYVQAVAILKNKTEEEIEEEILARREANLAAAEPSFLDFEKTNDAPIDFLEPKIEQTSPRNGLEILLWIAVLAAVVWYFLKK